MKRTILWSTSKVVGTFGLGNGAGVKKPPKGKKTVTAVKYTNRKGHAAYKGSSSLKSTQIPVRIKSKLNFGPLVTLKIYRLGICI